MDKDFLYIIERIKKVKGLQSDAEVARALGFSTQNLYGYKKRGTIPLDAILIFCEREKISFTYLLYGTDTTPDRERIRLKYGMQLPKETHPFPSSTDLVLIPLIGKIPAGFPKDIEHVIDYLHLPDAPRNAYAVIVDGDSMAPRIRSGDYVVFVEDGNARDGDVVVVRDEWGDPVLKRFRVRDNEVLLVSDNPEYPTIRPNENHRIVGIVVDIWTRKKPR